MNLALLRCVHSTELEEKKGTELLLQLGRGMAKRMESRDGSGRDPEQRCPQRPPEAQEGCGLEQMRVEPALPCCHAHGQLPLQPKPWHSATLSPAAGTAIPSPEGAELPELPGCRNGKDGERCLPYLRGQIASSCGQIKSDGDGLEEGLRFPCKANRLSLFPARPGSSQACLLGRESSLPQGE